MQRALLLAAVSMLAVAGARAQDAPSPSRSPTPPATVGSAPPQAPVGHRQPKMSDLPKDVLDQEKVDADQNARRRALEGDLDRQLRICSGC